MRKSASIHGKRPGLTRGAVLEAALKIIDAEGLEALSMRRVGDALGVEAMSLYNHVPNKAALLDGVYERILEAMDAPGSGANTWSEHVRQSACSLRAALTKHPHALALFASRPAATHASLARLEAALGPLRDAGLSPLMALQVVQIVLAYVVGHTMWTAASATAPTPSYDALDAKAFARVREVAKKLSSYDPEREFTLGLDALVAGLSGAMRA